jgi:steroid delta-isomerase-like uncharacterized protein
MSKDDVKELISIYIEKVWNGADPSALNELTTPDFRYHLGGQPPRDLPAMLQFLRELRGAFPDWRVQIETMVAEGHSAAVRWTARATHSGAFHGVPPSGKQISVCGINVYRIEEGKIVREWEQMDSLGMLQQLGALPPAT